MSERTAELSSVKLALLAQQVREQMADAEVLGAEPLAVVGMGCRFPGGADTPDAFWDLLRRGGDAVGEVPADRWDVDALYDPDPFAPGKINTRWGGFVDGVDQFDAAFFGISPREATRMDPQQRLLLEVAMEALERAGQPSDRLSGSLTGVFVASTMYDYAERQFTNPADIDAYSVTGNVHCIIANRLSYLLDLRGPSVAVDTACSSSLVAVHLACQSLRTRESDMALVGAVNVVLSPEPGIAIAKWGVMAADGRCKSFDARADGFVRGEGCGVVVLKRLADAIADNDPVVAVIRGSAVNQDGRSTAMSAPNGLAQQDVIRRALRSGQVRPEQIGCIEAHGTGTALGDPIEVEALAEVIGARADGAPPVALTAVKPNIGHLEAAAGIAGLIKVVLCLQHEEVPPAVHFTALNPHIDLEGTRLFIPTDRYPWPAGGARRLAGVSSFGFGGTNAHVVVEEAPRLGAAPPADGPFVLVASGQTAPALRDAARQLADHLAATAEPEVGDACATAAVRRTHHEERLAVVGATGGDVVERLRLFVDGERRPGIVTGRRKSGERRRIAFVLSGQGPQWWAMGRELMAGATVYREVIERCDELLRAHVDWSLIAELSRPEDESRLDQTEVAQPAIFAVQVGLAALWRSWGVVPDAVVGHSVGEVAAAHLSGALTLEDAIRVIAHRGRLMQAATGNGTMASVALTPEALAPVLAPYGDQVSVAAINAPVATVISGETAAMAAITDALRAAGANVRPLPVNYAFHSRQMETHARELGRVLADLRPQKHQVRFVSTVTGAVADGTELDGRYWAANVRDAVRFTAGVEAVAALGCDVFVEVGPHPVLGGAIAETMTATGHDPVVVASLRRGRPDREAMLQALGELHCCGVAVDWAAVMPGRRRVEQLPTYPWQHQRFWCEAGSRPVAGRGRPGAGAHPLVGRRVRSAAIPGVVFETELRPTDPAFLQDHRIGDIVLVPATGFLELAAAAFTAATTRPAGTVEDVELLAALALGADDDPTTVQVHLQGDAEAMAFTISSAVGDDWITHATGQVRPASVEAVAADLDAIRGRCPQRTAGEELYADLAARGVAFGPSFRAIDEVWTGAGEALGRIVAPVAVHGDLARYGFHPALLDAALHALDRVLPGEGAMFLPIALGALRRHGPPAERMWSHVRLQADAGATVTADVSICADDGAPLAELVGLRLLRTSPAAVAGVVGRAGDRPADGSVFELAWLPAAAPVGESVPAGPWLVVDDTGGVGSALAERLAAAGRPCRVVAPDQALTAADVAELVGTDDVREVVYLRGLDTPPLRGVDVVADQQAGLGGALTVAQALVGTAARLWLVTRGAHAVHGAPAAPEQATLSGLAASIAAEHPELGTVLVDLDPVAALDDAAASLAAALAAGRGDDLVAVRNGERHVARLVPLASGATPATGPTRLVTSERGVLDGLHLEPATRRPPGAGEIEIRVHATGLNFRDVLIALDLYPEPQATFGDECSGEVVGVGPGVERLRVGDRVMAMAPAAFASYVTTPADLAVKVPDDVDLEDAATIPIPFLTAYDALVVLGGLTAGERVLIHAGAGGVGMAAVQLARHLGAEVYATAGSPEKRATLSAMGVAHVSDSRSLDFAAEVLTATGGAGVDVVLNSLTGDFIGRSLDVVARGGRFLEIGRRDIWDAARVAAVRPDVAYHVVFLGDLSLGDPPAIQAMFGTLLPLFAAGDLRPLPRRMFGPDEVVDAFRYMAQARHTGKIVVRQEAAAVAPLRPDGTYLVTGGGGGIGALLARRLVERGARHVALVGRGEIGGEAIEPLRGLGAEVSTFRADVARRDDVARVLDEIRATMPTLRGIVHAAGVNDDAVLDALTWPHCEHVLAPKLAGAWHLHDLTRDLALEQFVLVSSASSVLGGPGQANYAAANAFLDSFAAACHGETGAGLSIGWGPWDRVGMTALLDDQDRARMSRRGIRPLSTERALATFERAVAASGTGTTAHVVAVDLGGDGSEDRSVLAALRPAAAPTGADLVGEWVAAVPGMRRAAIATFVAGQARKVLGLPSTSVIEPRQPFQELGLDSLMAVELRNAVGTALGRPQPATLLFDHPTSDALVDHLLELVLAAAGDGAVAGGGEVEPAVDDAELAALAELTEDEAEALLLAELGQTDGAS